MSQKVLSYDLGGTKIAIGIINARGKVLEEIRAPILLDQGKQAVLNQLATLGNQFLERFPEVQKVGLASAGPLDPVKGELLDPTNFVRNGKPWGRVKIVDYLKKQLNRKVFLENDAAAAVLAEHWIGSAKKCQNVMILTLGTGLGTGILSNGALVRSGQHLHTEGGHMILNPHDPTAICGCGNQGCAESYLSGKSFEKRFALKYGQHFKKQLSKKTPNSVHGLSGFEISKLAHLKNSYALAAFQEYSDYMAIAIHNYVKIFSPEVIVFSGSFAATAPLFLPRTTTLLKKLLARAKTSTHDLMPALRVSSLANQAGLIGGGYAALIRE